MERRDFLKRTGQAVALAAVTGGVGLIFNNRDITKFDTLHTKLTDFEIPPDPNLPGLSLARNENHINALSSSLDAVGGIGRFVNAGDRVTIKPNVGWDRTAAQAANTNPVLVGEMVRLCLDAGAAEVIVADVTCNDARRTFIRSGIKEAAEKAGARVYLPEDEAFVRTNLNGEILTVWPVLRYFIETDKFINMPIVKHHSLSGCTIGMKNFYGILGGQRYQLHQHIDQSIVDLAAFVRPTLTVVDATRVLMRNGPQGGSLSDVNTEHTVLCATDPVAADARGAEFLKLSPERVGHIKLAAETGLGQINYNQIGYKEIA